MTFDYSLDFNRIDFRKHPELYRVGKGEQGVLLVEPYKSEILPHWRFKTPNMARVSANKIYKMFLAIQSPGELCWHGHGSKVPANGLLEGAQVCQSSEPGANTRN